MYAQAGTHYEVGLKAIGELLIKDAFRTVYYGQTHSVMTIEIQQAVAFLRGSGLVIAISTFGLDYSPTRLRDTYQVWAQQSL